MLIRLKIRESTGTPGCRRVSYAVMMFASLWLVAPVSQGMAQQQWMNEAAWKRGYHGLSMICRSMDLAMLTDLAQWRELPANETLLIILGSRPSPIEVEDYLYRGGAVLMASDGRDVSTFAQMRIRFHSHDFRVTSSRNAFQGHDDCPIVTDLDSSHPVVAGLSSIVANRTGLLSGRLVWESESRKVAPIARLPRLQQWRQSRTFMVAVETQNGGRCVCLADQSVFSNQMLLQRDNPRLAFQSLKWLCGEQRRHVLLLADGQVTGPLDPSSVELLLPPPTYNELMAALRRLPPEVWIDFGNAVATALEDEGIINELIATDINEMPSYKYRRMLILLVTGGLVFFVVARIFSSGNSPIRSTKGVVTSFKEGLFRPARQRRLAAELIVDQFCFEVAGRSFASWRSFPGGISLLDDSMNAKPIFRSMHRINRKLRCRIPWVWTAGCLAQLERDLKYWRQLHRAGSLSYDFAASEVAASREL